MSEESFAVRFETILGTSSGEASDPYYTVASVTINLHARSYQCQLNLNPSKNFLFISDKKFKLSDQGLIDIGKEVNISYDPS
jgi:hypothetical protein